MFAFFILKASLLNGICVVFDSIHTQAVFEEELYIHKTMVFAELTGGSSHDVMSLLPLVHGDQSSSTGSGASLSSTTSQQHGKALRQSRSKESSRAQSGKSKRRPKRIMGSHLLHLPHLFPTTLSFLNDYDDDRTLDT